MSVATYLDEGQPQKIDGSVLTVAFPKNLSLHKETLERKENRELVEKSLSDLFNASLRVNFILSQEAKHKDDTESSAFIKSALDVFNGRVIRED
jgi:DNA polymerase-3 subunit gamma/tau